MKRIASRKDPRVIDLLIAHGVAGYGVYVLLVEYLGERKSFRNMADVSRIAYEFHADAEMVRSILQDFDLFEIDPEGNAARKGAQKPAVAAAQPADSQAEQVAPEAAADTPAEEASVGPLMSRSERRRQQRLQQKAPSPIPRE